MRDIKQIEERYRNRKPRGTVVIKKWYFLLILFLVAFFTNPGTEKHKKAVISKIAKTTTTQITGDNSYDYEISNRNINQLVDMTISSTDYLFFSTTDFSWNGQNYIIGIGFFGTIFFPEKTDEYLRRISY